MKNIDSIERLLEQTPAPLVVEGSHREQLKQRLLQEMQTAQPRRSQMRVSAWGRMSSLMKAAAVLLAAVLLIGTGWAAERIYQRLAAESTVFSYISPLGRTEFVTNDPNAAEAMQSDPNAYLEKQRRKDEEAKQVVAQKKYEFVRAIDRPSGEQYYVYWFPLSDGHRIKVKLPPPRLEEVASLDEYEKKSEEYAARRQKDIEEAIASGKVRLINVVFPPYTEVHVCRDAESGQRLDVRRIVSECPEEGTYDNASIYPGGMEGYEKPGPHVFAGSTWKDHLKAVRDGKRELLEVRIAKQYIYEATREDGSKFIFARDLPLPEKPAAK